MGKEANNKISAKDFSTKIKAQYPQYINIDDVTLAQKMIEKYPTYKNKVFFDSEKKKDTVTESYGKGGSLDSKSNIKVSEKIPLGVANQNIVPKEYDYKTLSNPKDLVKDIYTEETIAINKEKIVSDEAKKKNLLGENYKEQGIVSKATDYVAENVTKFGADLLGGVSSLVASGADLLIDKNPEKTAKAKPLTNDWFYGLIASPKEVKNPNVVSNQGVRDKLFSFSKSMSDVSEGENEVMRTRAELDPTLTSVDYFSRGEIKNGFKSAAIDVFQQVPQIAAMVMSGGSTTAMNATLGTMGAMSAGQNMQRQYEQDGDIDITDFAQGITVGIAEAVSEKIFMTDTKLARKALGSLFPLLGTGGRAVASEIAENGLEATRKSLVNTILNVGKQTTKGFIEENIEENIVSVVDFVTKAIDEDVFNEKGYDDLLKELAQNTIVTLGSGGGISLIAASASAKTLNKEDKLKLERYQEVVNNPNVSRETKKIAQQRISEINKGLANETQSLHDKIIQLPLSERSEAISKLNTIKRLEQDLENAGEVDIKDAIEQKISDIRAEVDVIIAPISDVVEKENIDDELNLPIEEKKIEKAVIEIGGTMYSGKNHAEAILAAKKEGKDISNVSRKEQGQFELSDGTIIDRSEAMDLFGVDRSELIIEQDEKSIQANKDYTKEQEAQIQQKETEIDNEIKTLTNFDVDIPAFSTVSEVNSLRSKGVEAMKEFSKKMSEVKSEWKKIESIKKCLYS